MLPEYSKFADWPYPQLDTSEAEGYIIDLLWTNGGTMDRKMANHALRDKDPQRMSNPLLRSLVIRNAASKNLFFVAKNSYTQVVGLTYDDAIAVANAANSAVAAINDVNSELTLTSVESNKNSTIESSSIGVEHSSDDEDSLLLEQLLGQSEK